MNNKTTQNVVTALLLITCAVIYFSIANQYKFIQDDTYISIRYAENLVNGDGLVFNSGERVEGYTNFLWVLILAFLKLLNINLVTASQILSTFFGLLTLGAAYKLSCRLFPSITNNYLRIILNTLPVYLLAFTGEFIYWSVSGMETSFFIFLITLSFYFSLIDVYKSKINYPALIVLILASLTRPEGLYFVAAFLLFELIISNKEKSLVLRELIIIFIPLLIHFSFRLIYYGYPLPNTFYAKSGFSEFFLRRGWEYFVDFATADLLYGFILVPPIFLFFRNNKNKKLIFFYVVAMVFILSIILIGGDVLALHRLFLPVLPLIYILFLSSIISVSINRKLVSVFLIIFSLILGFFIYSSNKTNIKDIQATEVGLVKKMKFLGNWVKEKNTEDGIKSKVALSTIGAFSYYSDAQIIDLLGLTNEYIAHNPTEMRGISEPATRNWLERTYNADYVLTQQPDYIIFPAGAKPSTFPEASLFINSLFQKQYYPQLLKSNEFAELLTIFTKRNDVKLASNSDCRDNASVVYINAVNLFLNYSKTRKPEIIDRILQKADSALNLCPVIQDDIYALKGMTYFFAGKNNIAQTFFERSLSADSMNSFSHFYLMNIYNKKEEVDKMLFHLKHLKIFSPSLFPNFELNSAQ